MKTMKQAPEIHGSCGCLAGPTPTIDATGHCLTFVPAVGARQTWRKSHPYLGWLGELGDGWISR